MTGNFDYISITGISSILQMVTKI